MTNARLTALAAVLLASVCACGSESSRSGEAVGRAVARGSRASVVVQGKAGRGQTLAIRVRSTPRQRVSGSWATTCTGAIVERDADDFGGRTPLETAVPRSDSAACAVTATARLARSGRLTVTLVLHR
jgi:hypothetical protein